MKVTLDYCSGLSSTTAIYLSLTDENGDGGGHRLTSAKPYGHINTIRSFELSERDLEDLISEAKYALKSLKKHNKKGKSA